MENEKKKPEGNPADSRLEVLGLILVLLIFLPLFTGIIQNIKESGVIVEGTEAVYKLESTKVYMNVEVNDTRTEKGKEKLYRTTFNDLEDRSIRFKKDMEAPEYQEVVGDGNNTVSGSMYTLTYYIPKAGAPSNVEVYHTLTIQRFSSFGQAPFSSNEIADYSNLLSEYLVVKQDNPEHTLDVDSIQKQTKSEIVTYSVDTLTKEAVAELHTVEAVAVE